MDPLLEHQMLVNRRQFFSRCCSSVAGGIGVAALGSLMTPMASAAGGLLGYMPAPHFAPKAKRIIYLFMSGAPSQIDMFDYKPQMNARFDEDLPESIRMGQRITTMTSGQARFPVAPSKFAFARHGRSGAWISELLPNTTRIVDDIAIIRSLHTEAINHDPGITYLQTGHPAAWTSELSARGSTTVSAARTDDLPGVRCAASPSW